MKLPYTMLPGLLFLLVFSRAGQAQTAAPEPQLATSIALLQQQYAESFPGQPQLYSGPEYVNFAKRFHASVGHQFFAWPEPQMGSVNYDGFQYRNLRLAYDVVHDQLALPVPGSPLALQLTNERVHAFTIENHRFVRLEADSASAAVIRTGFYEVLVDSGSQVLARRVKHMHKKVADGSIEVKFSPSDKLFIRKGGVYYPITKKSAVFRLFADRSKEMQQYVQAQQLSFKKGLFEASVVRLVRYYNQLTPQ